MRNTRPYLTTLTPLRGIAALLVVVFHCNLMLLPFIPWDKPHFIKASWLWVDFFFVLSGFIISYVYGENFKQSISLNDYWKYIKARFARVYPLHFVTMIWCLVCCLFIIHYANGLHPFFADMVNPMSAIPSMLLIQSLGMYLSSPLNTPSWSLSTEWWMYMIFPLLVPFFYHIKTAGKIVTGIAIATLFVFIVYYLGPRAQPFPGGPPTLNVIVDFGIIRCAAGFLLGMLAFKIYADSMGINFFKRSPVFVVLFGGLIIAMHAEAADLIIVALFPLIILAAAYNTTVIKKVLDTAILQRLGDWSFSIYMVHVPIMYVFWISQIKANPALLAKFPPEPTGPPDYNLGFLTCVVVVVLTLATAALSYRYIEVPARNYLNRKFSPRDLKPAKV